MHNKDDGKLHSNSQSPQAQLGLKPRDLMSPMQAFLPDRRQSGGHIWRTVLRHIKDGFRDKQVEGKVSSEGERRDSIYLNESSGKAL